MNYYVKNQFFYPSKALTSYILTPNFVSVRTSNCSAVRELTDGHIHRQTGPILLPQPLTRGGNKIVVTWSVPLALSLCIKLTGP